jgi:hypothetical protein
MGNSSDLILLVVAPVIFPPCFAIVLYFVLSLIIVVFMGCFFRPDFSLNRPFTSLFFIILPGLFAGVSVLLIIGLPGITVGFVLMHFAVIWLSSL